MQEARRRLQMTGYLSRMLIAAALFLVATAVPDTNAALQSSARARIAKDSGAVVAVVLRDPVSGLTLELNPALRFHAASTMKLGVLLELGRRIDAHDLGWTDSLPIKNAFASIVDGSAYALDPTSDSDSTVYAAIGARWSLRQLATRMVVRSSNLATNLLVERLGAGRITSTIRTLGADSMVVLRGVEDGKAFEKGLNNTTTARDLAVLLLALAEHRAVSTATGAALLGILEAQEFNDGIPAGLPPGTRVAHKTGEITATWHDAALVYPPDGRPYALVVLTRAVPNRARGVALHADLARLVHAAVLKARE
jgi:beta-lactamase class A